jgi:hypothetical protein
MLDPRAGDLVRLKPVRIDRISVCDGAVRTTCGASFPIELVEEILPRPFAVGDCVRQAGIKDGISRGAIVAIDNRKAWVQWYTGANTVHSIEELRRINES